MRINRRQRPPTEKSSQSNDVSSAQLGEQGDELEHERKLKLEGRLECGDELERRDKRFLQSFVVMFLCFSAAVFVFKRTDLFPWIGSCNAAGYDQDHYMAYCHSTRYGDYEHYALYTGSEERAVDAMKQAQVLFLGNSNTQYAFSTSAIDNYFTGKGISHYLLGFGQGAQSPVAEKIIRRHGLQPQVVVANIDPFFSTETNGTFQRVLDQPDTLHTEFKRKKQLQHWQTKVCESEEQRFFNWLCRGSNETLYRARSNGHWRTDYYRENLRIPVSQSDLLLDQLDEAEMAAREFMDDINVPLDCLVLTVTPKTDTPVAFAEQLAARMQRPLVNPTVDGLVTIDHSHLDKASASVWSSAFLTEFDRQLTQQLSQCIASTVNVTTNRDD